MASFGNVHTADFYVKASRLVIEDIIKNNSSIIKQINKHKYLITKNHFRIILDPRTIYIQIYVDLIKLLNKATITSDDSETIENMLNNTINSFYPDSPNAVLKRIDIRFDVILPKKERVLYFDLLKKTSVSKGKLTKYNPEFFSANSLYYKAPTDTESVRINIYDKPAERRNKGKEILESEKDVVRFEIQLLNRHLNYMKSRKHRAKKLSSYMSTKCRDEYINRYLIPILFKGKYRSLENAYKKIDDSSLSEHFKDALVDLITQVSFEDIDSVKNTYSYNTWKKYITLLDEMDINPITLPYYMDTFTNPLSR